VPHVAVNRSDAKNAVFIGVRNEPTAQESEGLEEIQGDASLLPLPLRPIEKRCVTPISLGCVTK
jgi:hypothetical protein